MEQQLNENHQKVPSLVAENHQQKKKGIVENDRIISISVVDQKMISKGPFNNFTTPNKDCIETILHEYEKTLSHRSRYHLGYPVNLSKGNYANLDPLMSFHINNCGDPFTDPHWGFNSRQFELGVLDWFAQIWEINKDDYWAYITNGGTEGNFHGLWIGRELLGDGILYASQDTHYSVFKIAKLYRMEYVVVESSINGEMDYEDFRRKLLLNKDKPAIVVANIGTTFKGAIDDLDLIIEILHECGFSNKRFYIHCDAALLGLMLPFNKHAPKISFKKPIGSISVSGHKFLGCPMPCGIQMTRKSYIDLISQDVEVIYSKDATISGSRNGHAAIYLWHNLSIKGKIGLEKDSQKCLENASYFEGLIKGEGIVCFRNEWSLVVVFERPKDDEIIHQWQLSCEGDLAHIVVLPNVTQEKLTEFFHQLISGRTSRTNMTQSS
ncbi:hypothetical protein Leryth_023362 [Lithospermum erythrorhizon]|nr:hypothetical protein Leryth_023362 [Lithospermum erythrorhizon]